jgi:hypothetical protein
MTAPPATLPPGSLGDEEDARLVAEVEEKTPVLYELGTTGLKRAAGYVDEEFLPQLRGRKAVQIFREMDENDPIVGAMNFAVRNLIKEVDWPVVPASSNREDTEAAKFVESCMDDMSHSWQSFIDEVLSCISYGWAWHEIVFKRRLGPWQRTGEKRSQYNDGLIGIRKLPIRAQDTLLRWAFDESGDTKAMIQLAPPYYQTVTLPITRSLLFRPGAHKNNPEGRSMLRNAYRPYFFKKRLEEVEAIGVERDLAGLPKVDVPTEYIKAKPGSDQYKMVDSMRKMVRAVRRNEQEGIIFPRAYDQDTKQALFEFSLLGSGGARQFSTDTLIQRYETRILFTMLADFIMVGHQNTGTYNMHLDKTGLFKTALNSLVTNIADTINRHLIPRLFAVNGWRPASGKLPKIVPGDVEAPDLTQLAQFLGATAGLGFTWGPDAEIERWLRRISGMPELSEKAYKARQKESRVEEATRYAEEQTRYLAARSALAQGQAEQQMMAQGIPPADQMQQAMGQYDQGQAAQQQAQQSQTDNRRAEELHQQQLMQGGSASGARPPSRSGGGSSSRPGAGSPSRKGGGRRAVARR